MPSGLRLTIVRLLLPLILLLQTGWAAAPQNTTADQENSTSLAEDIQSFIHSAGKIVFLAAWPTATYRGLSLGQLTPVEHGLDVAVRLNGSGFNSYGGSDLWLDLVFSFRNNQYQGFHLGQNNGFIPPFLVSELVAAIGTQLFDDYAASHPEARNNETAYRTPSAPTTPLPAAAFRSVVPLNSMPVLRTSINQIGPGVKSGTELLWALDNSLWIADGKPSERQLYVIASPCDYYSRQLYAASRPFTSDVQIRWIEMVPPSEKECRPFLGMLARGDSGLLEQAYEMGIQPGPVSPVFEENAVRWSTGVENAVSPILRYMLNHYGAPLQYPTLLWVSARGMEASMRPADLAPIVASIIARPDAMSVDPMSRKLMPAQYDFKPTGKRAGAKMNGVKLYAMPDERSQVASTLPKDFGYPIAGKAKINGEEWLELQLAPEPLLPNLFVRDTDVVKVK